jgi:hypothetical protein
MPLRYRGTVLDKDRPRDRPPEPLPRSERDILASRALAEVRPGLQATGQRMANAENNFISNVSKLGGISPDEATKVMDHYQKLGLLKRDAVSGTLNVKHGAFMDKDVINRALEATRSSDETNRTESLRDQHHGVDMTGPRGGSFHVSATGQKVYTRKG